jgi:hypothetical protein
MAAPLALGLTVSGVTSGRPKGLGWLVARRVLPTVVCWSTA